MLRIILVAALAATIAVAPGCGDDVAEPPSAPSGPVYLAPTSPDAVISNLATALRFRDLDRYAELLAPDLRLEVEDDGEVTDTLDRDQALAAMTATFESVISIDVSFEHGPAAPSDVSGFPSGEGYLEVDVPRAFTSIELRIDGDLWTVKGEGGRCWFVARDDEPGTFALHGWRIPAETVLAELHGFGDLP